MSTPNAELAYRVVDAIKEHPEHFDMDEFVHVPLGMIDTGIGLDELTGQACDTTACFAGWAVALSGYRMTAFGRVEIGEKKRPVSALAAELLGIGEYDAHELFYSCNENWAGEVTRIFGPRP